MILPFITPSAMRYNQKIGYASKDTKIIFKSLSLIWHPHI